MSEIRERAKDGLIALQRWNPLGTDLYQHDLIDGVYQLVTDLLAELERVENSREAECMECEKLACTEIRQQAAREAVEIIDKYPAFLFGTDAVGVKLNLSQSIKARFGLDG